jgi:hypothetical protein
MKNKHYSARTDWNESQTAEILVGLHLATLEPYPEHSAFFERRPATGFG